MDYTINNCQLVSKVRKHNQAWYKVYTFAYTDYSPDEKQHALTAQFKHEGDAFRYANILQANPGDIRLIIVE